VRRLHQKSTQGDGDGSNRKMQATDSMEDLMDIWKEMLPDLMNTFANADGASPAGEEDLPGLTRDDIVSAEGEEVVTPDATLTMMPSDLQSQSPSDVPSMIPSDIPSMAPSELPIPSEEFPSMVRSDVPTTWSMSGNPTNLSTDGSREIVTSPMGSSSDVSGIPSLLPSDMPSMMPSDMPSDEDNEFVEAGDQDILFPDSDIPSDMPSSMPSDMPSLAPMSWEDLDEDALDPNNTYFCPNTGRVVDSPTRDILYSYRLELMEEDTELSNITAAIENRIQVELTSGTETVCNATDMYLEDVVAITADPLDIPAAVCGVFTETTGDGACSYVSGRMRIALTPDGVADPMVEAGVYCRTLDMVRIFLDSGIIEEEMPEVAMVQSTILGQLVPSFCSDFIPNETIAMDDSLFEGEGEEDETEEADAGDRGVDVVDVVPASENESKSETGDDTPFFVLPLTVVLSVSLALLVAFVIFKRRRNANRQHQQDEITQELMEERVDMEDSFESVSSDDVVWPKTPDSGAVFGSMSDMDGASQLASPSSASNDTEHRFDVV